MREGSRGGRGISTARVIDRDGVTQFHITMTGWAKITLGILCVMPIIVILILTTLMYLNKAEIDHLHLELELYKQQHENHNSRRTTALSCP